MSHDFTTGWFACLLDATLRSLLLFALIGLLLRHLRRSSASIRHLALTLMLGSLLCLPLLSSILPRWDIPVLAGPSQRPSGAASASQESQNNVLKSSYPVASRGRAFNRATLSVTDNSAVTATAGFSTPTGWLFGLWLLGVIVVLLRFLSGMVSVRRIARRCHPVMEGRLYETANACSRAVGAKHSVLLVQSASEETPMVWGYFSPTLLLPTGAASWPLLRLRAVLLHEFAHIARGDWLTQVLAHVVCALYWFHPLVWWAARRIWIESECACDDLVLRAGFRSPDYAAQILEVFRAMKTSRNMRNVAMPMVRHSELEGRLHAVLEKGRSRAQVTRGLLLLSLAAIACLLSLVAALRPVAQAQGTADARAMKEGCQENLKQLGTALLMYAQDYDGKLPPMKTRQQVQSRVYPYLVDWRNRTRDPARADAFFVCPESQKSYQLNAAMSGKMVLRRGSPRDFVKNASQITLVRDSVPHEVEKARWNVLYADGHVAAVEKPNDAAGIQGNPDLNPRVLRSDSKKPPQSSGKKKSSQP